MTFIIVKISIQVIIIININSIVIIINHRSNSISSDISNDGDALDDSDEYDNSDKMIKFIW